MSDQSRRTSAQPLMNNAAAAAKRYLNNPLFKYSHLWKTWLKRRQLGLMLLSVGSSALTLETALQFRAAAFLTLCCSMCCVKTHEDSRRTLCHPSHQPPHSHPFLWTCLPSRTTQPSSDFKDADYRIQPSRCDQPAPPLLPCALVQPSCQ
jgi:hypothetical protein